MERDTIRLRKIRSEDVDDLERIVTDPEATRYIQGLITDHDMLLGWIESLTENDHEYIVELSDGTIIGECSLAVTRDTGDIGYILLPTHWRKGYGTTVIYALLIIASRLGLSMVTAVTDTNNTASVRLLEKTGFVAYRQGWMMHLSEEDKERIEDQSIVEYRRPL